MKRSLLLAVVLVAAMSSSALASGFAIIEQSVSGLGNAFAGGAASAEDASTIFFNPAGMTLLEGQQVVGGLHVIIPGADVAVTNAIGGGGSITADGGSDGGVTKVVPNLYYVNNLGNGLAFGLGINAPFGLATDYGKTWAGRYFAVESDVATININPSIAYQVTPQLSVGAGVSAQYIDATLSSMVDPTASSNPATDVFVENEADDWSYGFNLGLLYQVTDNTRIGFAYRSEVKQELSGTVTSDVPTAIAGVPVAPGVTIADLFQTQGVNGDIDLPATASLSVYQHVNSRLALMGDVTWTGWSSFENLTFNFEGSGIGGQSSSTTQENWDDTWRFSVGAAYQYNDALKLRCGLAYDQTPIPDSEHRTPRIPGEDRTWLSAGAGYKFSDKLSGDFAFTHLIVADGDMNLNSATAGVFVGSSDNSVEIISAQLSYNF